MEKWGVLVSVREYENRNSSDERTRRSGGKSGAAHVVRVVVHDDMYRAVRKSRRERSSHHYCSGQSRLT